MSHRSDNEGLQVVPALPTVQTGQPPPYSTDSKSTIAETPIAVSPFARYSVDGLIPCDTYTTPQTSPPPAISAHGEEKELLSSSPEKLNNERRICGMRRRNFWIVLGTTLVIIIAIAVGVGVKASQPVNSLSPNATAESAVLSSPSPISTRLPDSAAPPSATTPQTSCPAPDAVGRCDDVGCNGMNDSNDEFGKCTSGSFSGCRCRSTCNPKKGFCNRGGCAGRNHPSGGHGVCTAGPFNGCECISICHGIGACSFSGCQGVNGFCTTGIFLGCTCAPR